LICACRNERMVAAAEVRRGDPDEVRLHWPHQLLEEDQRLPQGSCKQVFRPNILCTGSVSYSPFILLFISICSVQRAREGKWGGGALLPFPLSPLCPGGGGRGWLVGLCHFVNSYIPIPHSSPSLSASRFHQLAQKHTYRLLLIFGRVFLLLGVLVVIKFLGIVTLWICFLTHNEYFLF
jgi:hypothetical protein